MKKKQIVRPFDAEIRQMRKNRVILVNITKVESFVAECNARGIALGKGSQLDNGVIMFEK